MGDLSDPTRFEPDARVLCQDVSPRRSRTVLKPLQKCPLCGNGCPGGHFHASDEPGTHHLCGAEHHCMQPGTRKASLCQHNGGCCIEGRIERVSKKFKGKRSEFEYEAVTRQNMARKVCTVMIPPGRLSHDGPCSCGRSAEEHYCGTMCPQCLYRCAAFICVGIAETRIRRDVSRALQQACSIADGMR